VAGEAHLPRGAKDAAHGAAYLGADAGCPAPFELHEDGFYRLVVRQNEKIFAGEAVAAVDGELLAQGGECGEGVQLLLKFWAEGGELGNGRYPLTVQVRPNFLCMIRRKAPALANGR